MPLPLLDWRIKNWYNCPCFTNKISKTCQVGNISAID